MTSRSLAIAALGLMTLPGSQFARSVDTMAPADGHVPILAASRLSGTVPAELEYIPVGYEEPADRPGTLEALTYTTYESFTYAQRSQELTKTAWVYLPSGYSDAQRYNVFYLSHGGWSDETTLMGTPDQPTAFKHIIDNAIAAGRIAPLIMVMPTYNNTSPDDSGDYGLALRLTDNFHNELVNDLVPAVESTYSTYAEDVTPAGLAASRDHRGFGGFSMGSVNTWRTFEHALDYFRYFMPMSGALGGGAEILASAVLDSGHTPDDFFIYAMSGTEDFAHSGFKQQIDAMTQAAGGTFVAADSEAEGNLAYREREGYRHDLRAAGEYTYNGLRFFWSSGAESPGAGDQGGDAAAFSLSSRVREVMADPAFQPYGRLLFPVDATIPDDLTLEDAGSLFTWYSNIHPDRTVEIVNHLHERAAAGEQVFYDIYDEDEKQSDPAKDDTGLFFFRGDSGARTAIVNAGGGFAYVAAMHDSFPQSLELSRRGYNAFALIYRPGARTGAEDLARAIAFLHTHADELGIDMAGYSLWGGSAGARLAAWLGSDGTAAYGEEPYPAPAMVVTQYTGLSEVTGHEPPTYANVGTDDGIADHRTMVRRIDAIRANGTPAEIEVFDGLSHGFGLGEGTVAEGWLDRAVDFWERNSAP